jgi:hypothetical protein
MAVRANKKGTAKAEVMAEVVLKESTQVRSRQFDSGVTG